MESRGHIQLQGSLGNAVSKTAITYPDKLHYNGTRKNKIKRESAGAYLSPLLWIPQDCHLSGFRLRVSILGDEITYWIYVTLHLRNLQIFDVPAFLGELKGQEGSVASEKTKMLNSTLFTIGSFYKIRLNTSMSIKN